MKVIESTDFLGFWQGGFFQKIARMPGEKIGGFGAIPKTGCSAMDYRRKCLKYALQSRKYLKTLGKY